MISIDSTIAGPLRRNNKSHFRIFRLITPQFTIYKITALIIWQGDKSDSHFPCFRINVLISSYGLYAKPFTLVSLTRRYSKALNGIFDLSSQKQKFANVICLSLNLMFYT
jgi:hypothetical protein